MKRPLIAGIAVCLFAASHCLAQIIIVAPEGDGTVGRDRYGFSYGWENSAFDVNANPNAAYHDYDSSAGWGSQRSTYMQFSLSDLPAVELIESITFQFNLLSRSGSGTVSTLSHASNSTAATGLASQMIGGSQTVMQVTDATPLGWVVADVTDMIIADVNAGASWSAFQMIHASYHSMTFSSGEDPENAARLVVTAVPEPSTMAGGLGLLALVYAVFSRRRK